MKIVVCIKQVPSSEARVQINADGTSIESGELELVVNPYDENAVEEALQIKEAKGGETIALTVGSDKAEAALRACLNQGIDKAMIVKDPSLQGGDFLGTAKILAAALKQINPDLILLGKLSIDEENSAVGPALAELLGLPHVTVASKLEWIDDTSLKVSREVEGITEILALSLPAVITANKGLNEPRYASLRGIMAAKKKPIEAIDPTGLGLDPNVVGAAGRKISILKMEPPPPRAEGKVLQGEPQETVPELVRLLREEAKVL
ncbi:MAG: electron transfer flavoprotein subunit beta/FixA family protein [Candidatus Eisenbacteria bacterium]|uniref:Electron transfer flavoprotein subunit beta n=1 Tax=Eiseniibacteriota bacterium TaxID=2212470 RepID=A0A948RR45_UNCEI|nr:electron transfer flavoprotein subunit beta/FixA family protein [Candidatus Eisenbacteria bacterium]